MRSARRSAVFLSLLAVGAAAAVPGVSAGDGPAANGLKADYFDGETLSGTPISRVDPVVDFAWEGGSPIAGLEAHTFSVRWTGTVTPRYSERYTFSTHSDDGVRVWIDGKPVIDDWSLHRVKTDTGEIDLQAGHAYDIRIEFFEHLGRAEVSLRWKSASQALEVVPSSQLAPPVAPVPTAATPAPPVEIPTVTTPAVTAPDVLAPVTTTTTVPDAPAPTDAAVLPPASTPVAGRTFTAAPVRGTVLVRGTDGRLGRLAAAATLPIGARLDTRGGAVRIDTAKAKGVHHPKQYARFSGATFSVNQKAEGNRVVDIDLTHGDFESCAATAQTGKATARAATTRAADKPVRQLWGHGKGRFETHGRGAVAVVRGTFWTVEDTCTATIVKVREGVVDVEDLGTGETVTLRAGESHVAPIVRGRD